MDSTEVFASSDQPFAIISPVLRVAGILFLRDTYRRPCLGKWGDLESADHFQLGVAGGKKGG